MHSFPQASAKRSAELLGHERGDSTTEDFRLCFRWRFCKKLLTTGLRCLTARDEYNARFRRAPDSLLSDLFRAGLSGSGTAAHARQVLV